MKKLVPMAVAAMCMATVAFASVHHSSVVVNPNRAMVDTVIPQDTTVTPTDTTVTPQDTTVTPQETPMEVSPVDTSTTTDTSSASHS